MQGGSSSCFIYSASSRNRKGTPKGYGDGGNAPTRGAPARAPEASDRVSDTAQGRPVTGRRRGDRGGVRGGSLLLSLLPGEPGRRFCRQASVRDRPARAAETEKTGPPEGEENKSQRVQSRRFSRRREQHPRRAHLGGGGVFTGEYDVGGGGEVGEGHDREVLRRRVLAESFAEGDVKKSSKKTNFASDRSKTKEKTIKIEFPIDDVLLLDQFHLNHLNLRFLSLWMIEELELGGGIKSLFLINTNIYFIWMPWC